MGSERLMVAALAMAACVMLSCWPGGGGSGDVTAGDQAAEETVCEPDCTGKDCGDDGCGGECGPCDSGYLCAADDQCKKQPTCEMVSEITCGETIQGDTTAFANEMQDYDCGNYEGGGGELVYIFMPEEDDTATAILDSVATTQEVLVTQAACDQQTCLAIGEGEGLAQFEATAGLKYYLVVDSLQGDEGPFQISLECKAGCESQCDGKECGDDGCYGSCGDCPDDGVCYNGVCGGPLDGCSAAPVAGCGGCECEACVCEMLPECCETSWHDLCVQICAANCEGCGEGYCGDFECSLESGENCSICPTDCPCGPGEECQAGECVPCEPDCAGKQCGNDGCGGSCGQCGAGLNCQNNICVEGPGAGCEPSDTPGCGGCPCEECVCGMDPYCCESAWDGICVGECADQCGGCGGDEFCGNGLCSAANGEDCTTCYTDCPCPDGAECKAGECVACEADCDGKECGDDGCGGDCGQCLPNEKCIEGNCKIEPGGFGAPCQFNDECESGLCFPTEVGGVCTEFCIEECPPGWECLIWEDTLPDPMFVCQSDVCNPDCLDKECGDDGCGGSCGACPEGECVDGECVVPVDACLEVSPSQIDFGGKKVFTLAVLPLEITSCGSDPLEISGIAMKEGSSPDFGLDYSSLDHVPSVAEPLLVGAGETVSVAVMFMPTQAAPVDAEGNLLLDTASIVVTSNASGDDKEVEVSGAGVDETCPVAVIKCAEGDEVIPQTVLHLYGDESYAVNDDIQGFQWTVVQPAGSQSVFIPASSFPNPTFETNMAGTYKFSLVVLDSSGAQSCVPAEYEVVVIPDEAIHIELFWHTPNDPDETDEGPEAGTDVDIHFAHPFAASPDIDGDGQPDPWFDIPYDCFWFNSHPNWGSADPGLDDDPGLDRDDTDGAGPENINLNLPENVTYKVGVHYWNDHGYGVSFVSLRVYIFSQLVFEVSETELVNSDMWEVCTLAWPSGEILPVTDDAGQFKITPDYQNPFFFQ